MGKSAAGRRPRRFLQHTLICPVLCLLAMRLIAARNRKDFWRKRRFVAKNSSWACGVYAEIFLFASANHFTETIAFSIIRICAALFSFRMLPSKWLTSYPPKQARERTAWG